MKLFNSEAVANLIIELRAIQRECERQTTIKCKDSFDKGWKRSNEALSERLDGLLKEFGEYDNE